MQSVKCNILSSLIRTTFCLSDIHTSNWVMHLQGSVSAECGMFCENSWCTLEKEQSASRCPLKRREQKVAAPQEDIRCSFVLFHRAHPASYTRVIGSLSLGVKRPGREANHSHPSSFEVKNVWSYTSTPQYTFMACCSSKKKARGQLHLYPYMKCFFFLFSYFSVLLFHYHYCYCREKLLLLLHM
jgi:hypothetical protein